MSKHLPLHKAARILGFKNEADLLLVLRLTPRLPYITRHGVLLVDPDELADRMAEHGITIPGDFSSDEDGDSNQDPDDDDEVDDAPVRRSRR